MYNKWPGFPGNIYKLFKGVSYKVYKKIVEGVPAAVQWVKSRTAVARVTAEAQGGSSDGELPYSIGAAIKRKIKKRIFALVLMRGISL